MANIRYLAAYERAQRALRCECAPVSARELWIYIVRLLTFVRGKIWCIARAGSTAAHKIIETPEWVPLLFLVEPTGIEPVSEDLLI